MKQDSAAIRQLKFTTLTPFSVRGGFREIIPRLYADEIPIRSNATFLTATSSSRRFVERSLKIPWKRPGDRGSGRSRDWGEDRHAPSVPADLPFPGGDRNSGAPATRRRRADHGGSGRPAERGITGAPDRPAPKARCILRYRRNPLHCLSECGVLIIDPERGETPGDVIESLLSQERNSRAELQPRTDKGQLQVAILPR